MQYQHAFQLSCGLFSALCPAPLLGNHQIQDTGSVFKLSIFSIPYYNQPLIGNENAK